jgi:acetyl-CoA carboxylase biotin carboxyl carrier protein
VDLQTIRDLIALMKESGVTELAVERPDYKISIKRDAAPEAASHLAAADLLPAEASQAADLAQEPPTGAVVSAPMVGIFYLGGAGDSSPRIVVGDLVEQGQVIAAIESMKVPNDILAPTSGRIEEIFAADGAPVEFGQPLLRIQPQGGPP